MHRVVVRRVGLLGQGRWAGHVSNIVPEGAQDVVIVAAVSGVAGSRSWTARIAFERSLG